MSPDVSRRAESKPQIGCFPAVCVTDPSIAPNNLVIRTIRFLNIAQSGYRPNYVCCYYTLQPFLLWDLFSALVHSPNPEHMTTVEAIRDRRGACQCLAPRNGPKPGAKGASTRRKGVMGHDRALGSQYMTSDTLEFKLNSILSIGYR